MKHYVSVAARCPFYHSEDAQKVYCEGVTDDTSIHLAFKSCAALSSYKWRYCYGDYQKCRLARMQFKRWDDNKQK